MVTTKDKQCPCPQHACRERSSKEGTKNGGVPCPDHPPAPKAKATASSEARILNACMPCASQHRPYPASLCHLPFPRASKRRSMWVTLTFMKITSQRPAGLEGHWRLSSPNHLNSQMRNQGSEMLSNLPKVTQLTSRRAGIGSQSCLAKATLPPLG